MAPVDPLTTDRLKVHYTGPFGEHTMTFHKVTAATSGDFIDDVRTVLTKLAALLWATGKFLDAAYALAGSPIFTPLSWVPINSTGSVTPDEAGDPARFLQFGGRSVTGVRTALYLFETPAGMKSDMRYDPGEFSAIDEVIAALIAASDTIGVADGTPAFWKNYANVNDNDFLVHKARH